MTSIWLARTGRATLLVSAALLAACGSDPSPREASATPPPAEPAQPIAAETATVAVPLELPAQLYVDHDAMVIARTEGIIESVYVDLGARVREGQLLARLESVDQDIAVAQAQEALDNARRILDRQRILAESGFVAPSDSELAATQMQHAALELRQAQRNRDLTRIVAPFNGAITARLARPRRLVAPGDSLFQVTALRPLLVSVRVPEVPSRSITLGSPGQVVAPGIGTVPARVLRASPTVDAGSGTREIILQVAAHAGLRPGTAVTVRLGAERQQVVAVPDHAVVDSSYVLVWEDGRATVRPVQLGALLPDGRRVITSGLEPGERLVPRQ